MLKKEKIWRLAKPNKVIQKMLSKKLGISPTLAQILINRNITTIEDARAFIKKDIAYLHNPFLFESMKKSVELIFKCINNREKILIFGDYDVDGITSTSLLLLVLKRLGAVVTYHIPDRKKEGYGLNIDALRSHVEKGIRLVITVDCGISSLDEAKFLQEQKVALIITDHHEPPSELPSAEAIINPKLLNSEYPFPNLAGVGVAFKLVQALLSTKYPETPIHNLGQEYLDVVAIGTVADIVPLVGENRIIVSHGLKLINQRKRIGIKALIDVCGLSDRDITAGHIGFGLAPRLNAAGRLSHAAQGVELILADFEPKAKELATMLNEENVERQSVESQITEEVIEYIENNYDLEKNKVIVLASERWHSGVIGIVASRIVDKYYRPTILLAVDDQIAKGSCRSIKGFDMFVALTACKDVLLKFGGHKQAAGLSLKQNLINEFREKVNLYADSCLKEEDLIPEVKLDGELTFEEISEELVGEMETLEPFGFKNPGPLLACRNTRIVEMRGVGKEAEHLKCRLQSEHYVLDGIAFKMGEQIDYLNRAEAFDFAFSIERNEFRGRVSLQLNIRDFKASKRIDNPFADYQETLSFVEELFSRADECLIDDYYRNIGDKEEFYTKVVGVSFEGRQEIIKDMQEGQELQLLREPANPYDNFAIRVETETGTQVGYLNAKLAKHLAPILDGGVTYNVLITSVTGGQDKHYGLNIILQKVTEAYQEKKRLELLELRKSLCSLNSDELDHKIQSAIIGSYSYRPKQWEAIQALLEGENTLAIFGTGRGKSAVFQTMAANLALKKNLATIIIYPLRALVNDQFTTMEKKLSKLGLKVFKANGSISDIERLQFFKAMAEQEVDIVLTTPEFIEYHLEKFQILKEKIGFFVVDESHHIGDISRPAYKRLKQLLYQLGQPLTLAVTATADDSTTALIIDTLAISKLVIDPYIRDNLEILDKRDVADKNGYINKVVKSGQKTIIYVNSRSKTIELANYLRSEIPDLREKIIFYNAGLSSDDRVKVEDMFRNGQVQTVVSTSAFGEGIDIPDVKHVVMYHLNFNFTEFNQQSGRAGRDGSKATIHLLCGKRDIRINEFILDSTTPDRNILAKLYLLLKKLAGSEKTIQKTNNELASLLAKELGREILDNTISSGLGILVDLELIEREFEGRERTIILLPNPKTKRDLEESLKFKEGMQEKYEFQQFREFLFKAHSDELLKLINRPIYPSKYNV